MIERVGAAPISWGICEAPGWGRQLPVDRVLSEMQGLGIPATELGALGWLPTEPEAIKRLLAEHAMELLGGFVPLVLHDPDRADEAIRDAHTAATLMSAAGGKHFVTAVVADHSRWHHVDLDAPAWKQVCRMLKEIDNVVSDYGMMQVVHPHVDTIVENVNEVERFLQDTDVQLCLDTGHLFIGGADPVAIARECLDRIGLVHLKDVARPIAERLRAGELTLMSATQAGLFPSVGSGDVDVAGVISQLESSGYQGWYVIEQDVAITDGEPPLGEGPVLGVAKSIEYIRSLASSKA